MPIRSSPPATFVANKLFVDLTFPATVDVPDNIDTVSVDRGTTAILIRLPDPTLHGGRRITIKRYQNAASGTVNIGCISPGNRVQQNNLTIVSQYPLTTAASGTSSRTFEANDITGVWELISL
jgi:hypothetical protein